MKKVYALGVAVASGTAMVFAGDPHSEVIGFSVFMGNNWSVIRLAVLTLILGGVVFVLIRKHGKKL